MPLRQQRKHAQPRLPAHPHHGESHGPLGPTFRLDCGALSVSN
jgi:hypothetical protein